LLGWRPEELLGTVGVNLLYPDDIIRDNPSSATEPLDHLETRFRIRRSDGTYIWVEATVRNIYNEDGTLRERLSVTRDITKRKAAEDHVNSLNAQLMAQAEKLETANKELEAFTYSVSHDLRAPLRAMDGFSKILSEKHRDQIPEEARRYLDRIRVNAVQMGSLIDDLLTLSRVSKRALERRECAMTQIAESAYQEVAVEQNGQSLKFVLADLPPCDGDPGLIKQVFVNLFANAVKFTRGRPDPTIEVGVDGEEQDNPIYFVRDNGIGFDMQYAEKIFGVFQRLHDSRQYEGTGVGLAIVQRIIHRHDGRIWVSSVQGEGTTFYFTLGGSDGRADG
jgi:light-regulated signal transduction histidine kinase (bacteriophytochrome)